jgi:hypothetical protein
MIRARPELDGGASDLLEKYQQKLYSTRGKELRESEAVLQAPEREVDYHLADSRGRKETLEMLGEFLRETGVLIIVFVPLDLFAHGEISLRMFLAVIACSLVLLGLGILVERIRP